MLDMHPERLRDSVMEFNMIETTDRTVVIDAYHLDHSNGMRRWLTGLFFCVLSACGGSGNMDSMPVEGTGDNGVDRTATVLGIDTDANGVRDDVDRLVTHMQSNAAEARAMLDLAVATQALLSAGEAADALRARSAFESQQQALHCIRKIGPRAKRLILAIAALSVNTSQRFDAWLSYEQLVATEPMPLFDESSCQPE